METNAEILDGDVDDDGSNLEVFPGQSRRRRIPRLDQSFQGFLASFTVKVSGRSTHTTKLRREGYALRKISYRFCIVLPSYDTLLETPTTVQEEQDVNQSSPN
ncbi:hypothetical protein M0802_004736 [Mischocyttarus mexicanus]|nr:hypothetical protein M0802_004736 [Mischocyttarus mexicanus]